MYAQRNSSGTFVPLLCPEYQLVNADLLYAHTLNNTDYFKQEHW
jgi:hypothetical protein